MFLVAPSGADIGTIAAWNDDHLTGRDIGRIHRVATTARRKGAGWPSRCSARPARRCARGFTEAYLEINTRRIPALNLYLRFGFSPHPRAAAERAAWHMVALRLKFPVAA